MKVALTWMLLLVAGCAPFRDMMKQAHENAQACKMIESRLDLLDERQKEMIRRLDSIDDRLAAAGRER